MFSKTNNILEKNKQQYTYKNMNSKEGSTLKYIMEHKLGNFNHFSSFFIFLARKENPPSHLCM